MYYLLKNDTVSQSRRKRAFTHRRLANVTAKDLNLETALEAERRLTSCLAPG